MPDNLVTVENPHVGLAQRLNPHVLSKADPEIVDLLQARADVQREESLKEIFRRSVTESWPEGQLETELAEGLRKLWPHGDPTDAAQFLADEYRQLGEGIHLVSTETGKVTIVLREEDIHQPAPVPREGGGMATPLPIIRPDLAAALVTWNHESAREANILEALAKKGHQTELLREMGDPRLLIASRTGRRHIVESLAAIPPKTLLEASGGSTGNFLKHFNLVSEGPSDVEGYFHIKGVVSTSSTMGIQDMLTTNLSHNRAAVLQGAIVQGWVREIAKSISKLSGMPPTEIAIEDLHTISAKLWVAPPDLVRRLYDINPRPIVLPVEGCEILCLTELKVGHLWVPPQFQAKSREFFSRWETVGKLDYEVWVDPKAVKALRVANMIHEAQLV